MKKAILIISIATLIACSEKVSDTAAIRSFENQLEEEGSKCLSKVITRFEKFILEKYHQEDVNDAYKMHLLDVSSFEGFTPSTYLKARAKRDSTLMADCLWSDLDIWMLPDSVWIEDEYLFKKYKGIPPERRRIRDGLDKDSIVFYENEMDFIKYNSSFLKGFREASKTKDVAEWYFNLKSNAGTTSSHIAANVLLKDFPNFEDYFVRRIILIETSVDGFRDK